MTELACGRPNHSHPLGVPPAQKLANRLYSYLLTATRASKLEAHKARDNRTKVYLSDRIVIPQWRLFKSMH